MKYEDIPAGIRSELYLKAMDLVRANDTSNMPFFFSDGGDKIDLIRSIVVNMYCGKIKI